MLVGSFLLEKQKIILQIVRIGVSHLDRVKTQTLFDRNGGVDDKRNRLEAATDQFTGNLVITLFNLGGNFPVTVLLLMMTIPSNRGSLGCDRWIKIAGAVENPPIASAK